MSTMEGLRVLVVDDDGDVRLGLCLLVESLGAEWSSPDFMDTQI